jgi:UDP-N-acetyl-D-mannosaminuronate dehydrogenase
MPKYCVEGLEALYGKLNSKHVLVVGVSYKPDISDTRESPAEFVVKELEKKGAKVSWHDPLVESFNGQSSASIAGDYDLALVLVKHQLLDMSSWANKPIYCVNSVDSEPEWIPILGSSRGK